MKDVLIILFIFFVIIFMGKIYQQKSLSPTYDSQFQKELDEWKPFD